MINFTHLNLRHIHLVDKILYLLMVAGGYSLEVPLNITGFEPVTGISIDTAKTYCYYELPLIITPLKT